MTSDSSSFRRYQWLVLLVASAVFLACIVSPPSLMDDVDSVQAAISRAMVRTGDWVTPHLDGVKYFEKPPLKYWIIAIFFKLFGIHDYIARLPLALITVALCWLTFRMGAWAFDNRAGLYSGLVLSTCVGLFLFTRVLISDSQLTFTIALAMWSFLRAIDAEEKHPRAWGLLFWVSIAGAILFKGLIGAVFPIASAGLFLIITGQLFVRATWKNLVPQWGIPLMLVLAAPWHVLATLRNPPYLYFSLYSGPRNYHGFFWFYFFNEHILRFLNRRYPRDYNTVPRILFWAFHLLWLFPWSVYFPALLRLKYRGRDRASRMRLLALCWIGFLLVFFSFSSTQEYYSMPAYPAIALLLGCAMASANTGIQKWLRRGDAALFTVCALASTAILYLLAHVWTLPTPGDISNALNVKDVAYYTLSLGHMGDLTLASFAYLRLPLLLALLAFLIGLLGVVFKSANRRYWSFAIMMALFFHAARLALVTFNPYLSSRPLATALLHSPPGKLIVDDQYYTFSSVFFYADTKAYLLNGRKNNLEYGSNAPGAPDVFIDDNGLARMWKQTRRYYLLVERPSLSRIQHVVGAGNIDVVKESGGKYLLTNHVLQRTGSTSPARMREPIKEKYAIKT